MVKFSVYLNRYVFVMHCIHCVVFTRATTVVISCLLYSFEKRVVKSGPRSTLNDKIMLPEGIVIERAMTTDSFSNNTEKLVVFTTHCPGITKTCLYSFDPLKPHFYTVKQWFTGVYIILFISAQKHRLWVLVRTASARRFNEYPQSMS